MKTSAPSGRDSISRSLWRFAALVPPRRNIAVMGCVVAASFADGFGIATLLPMIAVLGQHGHPEKFNALTQTILHAFAAVDLSPTPLMLLGFVIAGAVLKALLMVVALRQTGYAVADVTVDLRMKLVNSVIGARWAYYVNQPVGSFSNTLSNETTRAGDAYNAAMQMLSLMVQAFTYLLFALLLSWQLAAFTLLVSAFMLALLSRFVQITKHSAWAQAMLLRRVLARLHEVMVGIKPLKAMSRENHVVDLFSRDLADMKIAARRQVLAKNLNQAMQEPIIALCLSVGIFCALQWMDLPLGEVIVMSLLLAKIVLVVGRAQGGLQDLRAAEHGFNAVQDAIDKAVREVEPPAGTVHPHLNEAIEFRNVGFAFGEQPTLHDVNLSLRAGEVVALTGPSGAGKTTLIDLMLGLHLPQRGQVLIDGISLDQLDRIRWRSMIGYAPQEVLMFHDSIAANVTLGESACTTAQIEQALRVAHCWEFVQKLPDGVNTVVGERGAMLSGGQRQRIALARAIVHRPRLLILDEGTNALDPATEAQIINNILRLVHERGLTVLAVSHHPAWIEAADRVLSLQAGRLSELPQAAVRERVGLGQ